MTAPVPSPSIYITLLVQSFSVSSSMARYATGYVLLMVLNLSPWVVYSGPQVPCYFIFGASGYDNGNNNNLQTTTKANYPPYGIDFPLRIPTGRFTNGLTVADFITKLLRFAAFIPSYASTFDGDLRILRGVNYASGGSGIRNETGRNNLGVVINMDWQLRNHERTVSRLTRVLGNNPERAKDYLGKCLYTVGMGSNDYLNNYFRPQFYNTSQQFTPQQFAVVLVQQFSQQLRTLYSQGARKVALFGISQVGCAPAVLAAAPPTNGSSCVVAVNNVVQLFNAGLRQLVDTLNNNLTDAKFTYINSYQIAATSTSGFRVTNAPCCPSSPTTALCNPQSIPCGNRSDYIWWDAIHPTEAANRISAARSYRAQDPSDAYPFDINTLLTSTP